MRYTGRVSALICVFLSEWIWMAFSFWEHGDFQRRGEWIGLIAGLLVYSGIGWWIGKNYDKAKFYSQKDSLTDTFNRNYFMKKASRNLAVAEKHERKAAVLCLGLDRFKNINDSWGHSIGDRILREVAARVKACLNHRDLIARSSGDEFVILLEGADKDKTEQVVTSIIGRTDEPFYVNQQEFHLSSCIGISLYPEDGKSLETLIRYADTALYMSKKSGTGQYQFYTEGLGQHFPNKMNLEKALRTAVKEQQFILNYQPKIDLKTGRLMGVEALIRWEHPEIGLIAPDRFIPLAEELDLIVPIGEWVLDTACRKWKKWTIFSGRSFYMSVNLSPRQLLRHGFVEKVEEILKKNQMDPWYLVFEITENITIFHSKAMVETLHQLKTLGVKLAVDDFGTGYASLGYLMRLPIDVLKIDKSFTSRIQSEQDSSAIINGILVMAADSGMMVIAEGIETEAQHVFLKDRCDYGQGFLFSKPLPALDLEKKYFAVAVGEN
ncbi:MAG TPA: EAL domain-containing protein [Bacillales bacterium]|nr:EAL domain-containing protein [Bacillales bacterium]